MVVAIAAAGAALGLAALMVCRHPDRGLLKNPSSTGRTYRRAVETKEKVDPVQPLSPPGSERALRSLLVSPPGLPDDRTLERVNRQLHFLSREHSSESAISEPRRWECAGDGREYHSVPENLPDIHYPSSGEDTEAPDIHSGRGFEREGTLASNDYGPQESRGPLLESRRVIPRGARNVDAIVPGSLQRQSGPVRQPAHQDTWHSHNTLQQSGLVSKPVLQDTTQRQSDPECQPARQDTRNSHSPQQQSVLARQPARQYTRNSHSPQRQSGTAGRRVGSSSTQYDG